MSSLTPGSRSDEATQEAAYEGLFNGVLTLLPSMAAVGYALKKYPGFASRTNWQSRTAITIMPAMFVAALSSELKLAHKMKEIAQETQHVQETAKWANEQWEEQKHATELNESQHLNLLYQQSLRNSNVCIVPHLQWYHKSANFVAANPIKVLAAAAIPTYVWIFRGNNEKQHLQFATKIMHTRVLGQAAAIGFLLTVMGFKDYMDSNGRFISQAEADGRVREMELVRNDLLLRLEEEQQRKADARRLIKEAHEKDAMKQQQQQHQQTTGNKTKQQRKSLEKVAQDLTEDATEPTTTTTTAMATTTK